MVTTRLMTAALLLVACGFIAGMLLFRPVAAGLKPSACPGGRFVVQGEPLVAGGAPVDADAVVLETPGPLEAGGPQVLVRSGCIETPVEIKTTPNGTMLTTTFPFCRGLSIEARLDALIDTTCRSLKGTFRPKDRPLRHFAATRIDDFDGRVRGVVLAIHGDAELALPGATVRLEAASTGEPSQNGAVTDGGGFFELPRHGPGSFLLCAEAPGFAAACDPEPIELSPASPEYKYRELRLAPAGDAIHGRVLLADGAPCARGDAGAAGATAAVGLAAQGTPLLLANRRGEYVLPGLEGPGQYEVRTVCEDADLTQTVLLGADELAGRASVDLRLPNSAPTIALLSASLGGTPVRSAAPGAVLDVTVVASDPDGDALHYAWRDGAGLVTSADAPTIAWPLLAVPARNILTVHVTDGKGGHAERELTLSTSQAGDRFVGRLADGAGRALAGASVRVDGQDATTDAAGGFTLAVAERERHVLTVRAPGHALLSQAFYGNGAGLDLRLRRAQRIVADPAAEIDVRGGTAAPFIQIPPNALVGPDGAAPTSVVNLDLYAYTRGEEPGDRQAADAAGNPMTARIAGALSLDVTDAAGTPYQLGPGAVALVSFKAPAHAAPSLPREMPLLRYDEGTGIWAQEGTARRVGDRYVGTVRHLSAWAIGELEGKTGCLRIEVDDNRLERPFRLRLLTGSGKFAPFFPAGEFTITDKLSAVFGIPELAYVQLHVSPLSNPGQTIRIVDVGTVPATDPETPAYPWVPCKPVALTTSLPSDEWLYRVGYGSDAEAEAYYASIGARPGKDTFPKWLQANGFQPGDAATDVVFFNPNELGLGRRANCRQRVENGQTMVGCYVTKYGDVGGSPDEALYDTIHNHGAGDTVAMEFSPGPGSAGERIVKFYIYGADGPLKTHTAFDTQGSIKHVPHVCLHCHGVRSGSFIFNDGGDIGAKFVVFDPFAYRFPSSGPHTREAQQARFRELNAMVAYTFKHTGPGWDLMQALYPAGVHSPGAAAVEQPVPSGWAAHPDVWKDVVKPACRTCHMYQSPPTWTFEAFDTSVTAVGVGVDRICQGDMPNAMAPMLRLWRSSDPFLPDLFASSIGLPRACGGTANQKPTVEILAPADGQHVAYGGLNLVTLHATASDPEDGSPCCAITWTDAAEGVLGHGHTLDVVISSPGPHVVRAVAYDTTGIPSDADEVTLVVDNTAPVVTIFQPEVGAVLYRNVPYKLFGRGFDANEPFLTLPCSALEWTSSRAGDATLSGCLPITSFTTLGPRTLTLTGVDSEGGVATAQRAIDVVDAPPNSPPVVVIFDPDEGDRIDPNEPILLSGDSTDPNGAVQPVTYQWTVVSGGTETPIGSGKERFWTPSADVPFHCGGADAQLRLYATDPDGTGVASVAITVDYPVC